MLPRDAVLAGAWNWPHVPLPRDRLAGVRPDVARDALGVLAQSLPELVPGTNSNNVNTTWSGNRGGLVWHLPKPETRNCKPKPRVPESEISFCVVGQRVSKIFQVASILPCTF